MELRHLKAFATVAEERHFGRAAERLGITQPPLSRQIQQLEAELGIKLLLRNARSVTLTKAGDRYLTEIQPHLAGLGRAATAARATNRSLAGKVRVGFVSNLAYGVIPKLLMAMKNIAPHIAMELMELPGPEQLRLIRERRLDVAFVVLPITDLGLKLRLLVREPLVVALSASHPLARRKDVPLKSAAKEKFIFCPRFQVTGFHELILDMCRSRGFDPHVAHESSSSSATMEFVAGGVGISIVPQSASINEHEGVVFRPLAGKAPVIEIGAAWLNEAMTPALRTFLDQAVHVTTTKNERLPQFRLVGQERPKLLPSALEHPGDSQGEA